MSTDNPFARHALLRRVQDTASAFYGRPFTLEEAAHLIEHMRTELPKYLAAQQQAAFRIVTPA